MENNSTEKEIWKDVVGYEGYYQVSNIGNVRSCERVTSHGRIRKAQNMKIHKTNAGYFRVQLCKNGIRKKYHVHRLVALSFVDNPLNKPDVNHIDEDKTNNFVGNLEWCTAKENVNHGNRAKKFAKAKNKPIKAFLPDGTTKEFESLKEASLHFGILKEGISSCALGKRKTYKNTTFKYIEKS